MTRERGGDDRDEGIAGACRLGEHVHCHGNVDLKAGKGPAVPLLRCGCSCHRGRVRVQEC